VGVAGTVGFIAILSSFSQPFHLPEVSSSTPGKYQ
jgi:hypothetical protein